MGQYPKAKFTVTLDEKPYRNKPQKKLVGSFLNENGEKILISIDIKKSYSPKDKKSVKFHYATAVNLGYPQERGRRNQMG